MGTKRFWERAAKGLALLALAAIVPACSDEDNSGSASTSGAGADTPLNWQTSYGTSGDTSTWSATGDTPLLWTDPNSLPNYIPVTIGQIIRYNDTRTYTAPTTYIYPNRGEGYHPLQTTTTTQSILIPEDNLAGRINALRSSIFGVGAGGGVGGGIAIGNTAGIFIPMHGTAREVARAHCHHFSGYHSSSPFSFQNEMGDWFGTNDQADIIHFYPTIPLIENYWWENLTYTPYRHYDAISVPAPVPPAMVALDFPQGIPAITGPDGTPTWDGGRLGRSGVWLGQTSPWSWADFLFVGRYFDEYTDVYRDMISDANQYYWLTQAAWWTHMGVGFWVGGPQTYYWEVAFLDGPDPAY